MAILKVLVWLLCSLAVATLHAEPLTTNSTPADYRTYPLRGWQVYYEAKLLTDSPHKLVKVLTVLDDKLEQIQALLPAAAIKKLQEVPIWLSRNAGTGLVYHASRSWLVVHKRNPAMSRGVELQNVDDFLVWVEDQPMVLLHELAHALHHRVYSYQQILITQAFNNATEKGLYKSVQRYDGSYARGYALEDEREYFAELTEAYYGRNDYYPFNREELKAYDAVGYKMVDTLWNSEFSAPTLKAEDTATEPSKPTASAPALTPAP